MDIEVTVRNDGSLASGIITVQMLILHNEYERFELANRTVTMNSLVKRTRYCNISQRLRQLFWQPHAGDYTLLPRCR